MKPIKNDGVVSSFFTYIEGRGGRDTARAGQDDDEYMAGHQCGQLAKAYDGHVPITTQYKSVKFTMALPGV